MAIIDCPQETAIAQPRTAFASGPGRKAVARCRGAREREGSTAILRERELLAQSLTRAFCNPLAESCSPRFRWICVSITVRSCLGAFFGPPRRLAMSKATARRRVLLAALSRS